MPRGRNGCITGLRWSGWDCRRRGSNDRGFRRSYNWLPMTDLFSDDYALALDAADPLSALRGEFHLPRHGEAEQAYFCGNSLGLQPRGARAMVDEEIGR